MQNLVAKLKPDGTATDEFKAEVVASVAMSHAKTSDDISKWLDTHKFAPGSSIDISIDVNIDMVEPK